MEITNKKVMVLGGYGEVGSAICRRLLPEKPKELIITSLREEEAFAVVEKLRKDFPTMTLLTPVHGNLFVRSALKDIPREVLLSTSRYERWVVEDTLEELSEEILTSSVLFRTISDHRPDIIVDCINTATALAYQNVYQSYRDLSSALQSPQEAEGLIQRFYRLLTTLTIPALIRHIQILYESMRRYNIQLYLKIGTTGTGGMGLNIPFTHGEEQPSRLLLSKTAVAGAHTLLLYLLNRTPGGPVVKEIKPAALIGWKGIGNGRILRGGEPIPLYDCPPNDGYRLVQGQSFSLKKLKHKKGHRLEGKDLEGTFIDTGENGLFSLDEFRIVTALGLMEYMTPEEIAQTAVLEVKGTNTSKDVIASLSGAVMGPTYRAGFLRQRAIAELKRLGGAGIAYGFLGPRTTKLIFEASLIGWCYGTLEDTLQPSPEEVSQTLQREVEKDPERRSEAISLGIPILLGDGETLLFANRPQQDKRWEEDNWFIKPESIDRWAFREWIDLRPKNMARWHEYFNGILREIKESVDDVNFSSDRGDSFWRQNYEGKTIIEPGEIAAWIMLKENGGRTF
jgi:hypothetical protein